MFTLQYLKCLVIVGQVCFGKLYQRGFKLVVSFNPTFKLAKHSSTGKTSRWCAAPAYSFTKMGIWTFLENFSQFGGKWSLKNQH